MELALRGPKPALTTPARHIDEAWMREAYRRVRTDAAVNVEDETAAQYQPELEVRLTELLQPGKVRSRRPFAKYPRFHGGTNPPETESDNRRLPREPDAADRPPEFPLVVLRIAR